MLVFEKRILWEIAILVLLVLGALAVGGVIIYIATGVGPLDAYSWLVKGAFGNVNAVSETLVHACPILFIALGFVVAGRCNLWNVGGDGQLLMGGLGAFLAGYYLPLPAPLLLVAIFASAFALGAAWGAIAGFLKAKMKVNEIVSTIMLNFIAFFIIDWLVLNPMRGPMGIVGAQPMSDLLPSSAHLPRLISGYRLHIGILVAIAVAILAYILLWRTPFGYRVRAIGYSPKAAEYSGMNISRNMMLVMILAGGISALAGAAEVAGIHHALRSDIAARGGYASVSYMATGIIAGMLGRLHPLGVIPSSIFFGALISGGDVMRYVGGIPYTAVFVLQGLVFVFIIAGEILIRMKVRR